MSVESISPDSAVAQRARMRFAFSPAILHYLRALEFVSLVAQLVLLAIVIDRYNLESPAFLHLTLLVFGGFVVHYSLPLVYRLPFFLLLSLAAIVLVLGWQSSAWLIGLGLTLIGACHLPVAFSIRLIVLFAMAAVLAAARVGWIPTPMPVAVWPILASMFMFRLMVYLYHLRFKSTPSSMLHCLSYFFMLPNVCFPLFPVVDYQAFVGGYFDKDRHQIYQVGVRWMIRGVVQLILYRIIYKDWSISLYEVANAGDLVHYCLWLFLLYLRVSGQFHLIVGMLHLFGFNLPETHKLYYLASSFTDFWRRINIYWKDFMMKLFFYPMYFRLRKRGPLAALVVSTLVVFLVTWLLHAVQWFWLRGTFLLAAHDALFWLILAALVVVNSLWEVRSGMQRTSVLGGVSWPAALGVGLKTMATFTVICILWSMWTSESITAWQTLWQFALVPPTAGGWLLIGGTVAAIMGGGVAIARYPAGVPWSRLSFLQETVAHCAIMLVLAAISINAVNRQLGGFGQLIASAKTGNLNPNDMAELERGYYEDLLDVRAFNGELASLYMRRPPEWQANLHQAGMTTPTRDILQYQLKPSAQAVLKGAQFSTNRWAMHDKEYSTEPPAGCYRIALLGASHAMGLGVEREKTFEALLEDRLNHENMGGAYTSYEILNFAVAGYLPVRQVWVLEDKVLPFKPTAVFYVAHPGDAKRAVFDLVTALQRGVEFPDPYLRDLARQANVNSNTPEPLLRRRLAPFGEQVLSWTYHRLVATCQKNNILPVFILLPEIGDPVDVRQDLQRAKDAGFIVLDSNGVYDGRPNKSLWIAEWDGHPNALGHQLVANRLFEELQSKQVLPLGRP